MAEDYERPDYDESRAATHEVTYRNWLGVKVPRLLTVSYQRLELTIADRGSNRPIVRLPASAIRLAMPSEHVETQVTLVTPGAAKKLHKVWLASQARARQLIRDVGRLLALQRDVRAERE